jgi:hypothetical protein
MPAGSLQYRQLLLTVQLRTVQNAPLPNELPQQFKFIASVADLSPVELSARSRLTSELLRFL